MPDERVIAGLAPKSSANKSGQPLKVRVFLARFNRLCCNVTFLQQKFC